MRNIAVRATMGLAVAAGGIGLLGAPATAAAPSGATSGLTFYSGTFTVPVLNVADPNGSCAAMPATVDSLIGWSGVTQVLAYRSVDCSGTAFGLGTLRTFSAGQYASFRAR